VAYAYMEKHHGRVGWGRWMVIAVPSTLVTMIIASALIAAKGQIGWY
jgi:hypothetical protein